jgi:hypothetical protein
VSDQPRQILAVNGHQDILWRVLRRFASRGTRVHQDALGDVANDTLAGRSGAIAEIDTNKEAGIPDICRIVTDYEAFFLDANVSFGAPAGGDPEVAAGLAGQLFAKLVKTTRAIGSNGAR